MRKALAFILPPIAIILIAFGVVSLWMPNEELSKQVTLGAAIIGAGGFALNYVLAAQKNDRERKKDEHERQKKEEEGKEILKATPLAELQGDDVVLSVELYNAGKCAINIRHVKLVRMKDGIKQSTRFVTDGEVRELTILGVRSLQPDEVHSRILEPKQHAVFRENHNWEDFDGDTLAPLPHEEYWYEIESYAGNVTKIPGKEIQKDLLPPEWFEKKK